MPLEPCFRQLAPDNSENPIGQRGDKSGGIVNGHDLTRGRSIGADRRDAKADRNWCVRGLTQSPRDPAKNTEQGLSRGALTRTRMRSISKQHMSMAKWPPRAVAGGGWSVEGERERSLAFSLSARSAPVRTIVRAHADTTARAAGVTGTAAHDESAHTASASERNVKR